MGIVRKTEKADLRRQYTMVAQVGAILALAVLILALRVPLHPGAIDEIIMPEQETVQMEEILQTKQIETPPPPPKPPVPVEVPDDELLDDEDLDLDASLDLDEPLADLPPPPPPAEDEEPEPEIFVIVEQMPDLIGGLEGLQKKITYPPIAKKAGVEGRVFVTFVVNEQGDVENAVVTRGIGAGCDEEALKAVRSSKFKPGKQRGKAVKVKMSLPVTFKLK